MKDDFNEFQLEEYKNISTAHFKTNKQIALFFRYYLLIVSGPAIIILMYDKNINKLSDMLIGNANFYETIIIGAGLIIISLVGIFACLYIMGLLQDSTLYAKTVNGTRRFFYDLNVIQNEEKYRVLPKVTCEPKSQITSSLPILILASIINSVYFSLGTYIISLKGLDIFLINDYKIILFYNYSFIHVFLLIILLGGLHWLIYLWIKNYRNYSYLKSFIIGIDIDGVLNQHRRTFCTLLWEKTKKSLWEDEVVRVPVSLIPNKNINRNDEYKVFNDLNYWIKQEVFDNKTANIIDELRNGFGYKIKIFSYRPWPDIKYRSNMFKYFTLKKWWVIKICGKERNLPYLGCLYRTNIYRNKLRYFKIKSLTRDWLERVNIKYDKLVIETNGIDNTPARFFGTPKLFFKNRYYFAKKEHFRYFVEDVVENAVKLSLSCDYVFLIRQPYNSEDQYPNLPANIIRVENWSEIKEKIRELG